MPEEYLETVNGNLTSLIRDLVRKQSGQVEVGETSRVPVIVYEDENKTDRYSTTLFPAAKVVKESDGYLVTIRYPKATGNEKILKTEYATSGEIYLYEYKLGTGCWTGLNLDDFPDEIREGAKAENDQYWYDVTMQTCDDGSTLLTYKTDKLGDIAIVYPYKDKYFTYGNAKCFYVTFGENESVDASVVKGFSTAGTVGVQLAGTAANDDLSKMSGSGTVVTENGEKYIRLTFPETFNVSNGEVYDVSFATDSEEEIVYKDGQCFIPFPSDEELQYGKRIRMKYSWKRGSIDSADQTIIYVLVTSPIGEITLIDDKTGTELLTNTSVVSGKSRLIAEEIVVDPSSTSDAYSMITKNLSESSYAHMYMYCWGLQSDDSKTEFLSGQAQMRFKIPDGWNANHVKLFALIPSSGGYHFDPDVKGELDETGKYFVITTNRLGNYALYETKDTSTSAEDLADGTYEVPLFVEHLTNTGVASMANRGLGDTATVVVKDGEKYLYTDYTSIENLDLESYLTKMWIYGADMELSASGAPQGTKIPVIFDSYYHNEDGSFLTDDFNEGTLNYYPKTGYVKLVSDEGRWPARFKVPVMDLIGGGNFEQDAWLNLDWANAKKINGETPDVPIKDALGELIAIADTAKQENYTADSWSAMQTAYDAAKEADKVLGSDITEMETAYTALRTAIESLEEKPAVSKDTLQKAVDTANEKLKAAQEDPDLYTAESVSALQTAVASATEVLTDDDADQDTVDQAVSDLNAAIEALTENTPDRTPLEEAIAAAEKLEEDAYTPNSFAALTAELEEAKKVLADENATAEQIDAAVKAINAKRVALITRADTSALKAAYEEAAAIEDQSQTGWDELQTVLAAAKQVYEDANATQQEVDDQVKAIQNAVANLGSGPDKSTLESMIGAAEDRDTSGYSDASVKAFRSAIKAAKKVFADDNATSQEIDKEIQLLNNAAEALIQKADPNVVYDGVYNIDGRIWHAAQDQASMANSALAHPMQLVVEDGKATLRMEYKSLTTSLGKTEFTGYLAKLYYFPEWDGASAPDDETPVETTTEEVYEDVYDAYNDPETGTDANIKGQEYPKILSMPVELGDGEIWVQVYVPVMEGISAGSGTQVARLQLDWDTLEQLSGAETDKAALDDAVEQAKSLRESLKEGDPGYTEKNLAALDDMIANGEDVSANLNVNQTAVDAVAKALKSAMNLFSEEAVETDKAELAKAIETADTYLDDADSFTATSLNTLKTSRENAQKVYDDANASQSEVNAAVSAVDNAIQSLTKKATDRSALRSALANTANLLESPDGINDAERNLLQNVYDDAQEVFDDPDATQEEVDAQARLLNQLLNTISPTEQPAVEKAGLHDVITAAANMLGRDHTYTLASRQELKKAIRAAEKVYDDPDATQAEVNEAANDVVDAMLGLEAKEDNSGSGQSDSGKTDSGNSGKTDSGKTDSGDNGKSDAGKTGSDKLDIKNLEDGVYVIHGNMVKTNKKDASMSDKAINHNIKLTVKDGKYYITMDFNGLKVGNDLGYLGSLKYFKTGYVTKNGVPTGEKADVAVDSVQKNADGSVVKDDLGTDYPDLVTFELIPEALEDGYVPLEVFVPIMESISAGNGTQPVYLKLDWSTIEKTTADDEVFTEDDNNEDASSPAVDLTDKATGIHVTADAGVLPEGVKLVVTPIKEGTDYDKAKANTFIVGNDFVLYDIHFEGADGNEVEPNGSVTVSIPIPDGWDTSKLGLYHFNDDGSVSPIIGTAKDGMYTFRTNSFSNFALVQRQGASLPSGSELGNGSGLTTLDNKTGGSSLGNGSGLGSASTLSDSSGLNSGKSLDNVKTGDDFSMGSWAVLALIAAGALAVVLAGSRKAFTK